MTNFSFSQRSSNLWPSACTQNLLVEGESHSCSTKISEWPKQRNTQQIAPLGEIWINNRLCVEGKQNSHMNSEKFWAFRTTKNAKKKVDSGAICVSVLLHVDGRGEGRIKTTLTQEREIRITRTKKNALLSWVRFKPKIVTVRGFFHLLAAPLRSETLPGAPWSLAFKNTVTAQASLSYTIRGASLPPQGDSGDEGFSPQV